MSRPDPGLLAALSRVGASLISLFRNRLELAGLEIAEARRRVMLSLVAALAAVLLFGGALVALTAWVAVALWARTGPAVLAYIGLAYGLGGLSMLWCLRRLWQGAPPLFEQTLAELRNDAASLRGGPT